MGGDNSTQYQGLQYVVNVLVAVTQDTLLRLVSQLSINYVNLLVAVTQDFQEFLAPCVITFYSQLLLFPNICLLATVDIQILRGAEWWR
jgi:hypothetical protein